MGVVHNGATARVPVLWITQARASDDVGAILTGPEVDLGVLLGDRGVAILTGLEGPVLPWMSSNSMSSRVPGTVLGCSSEPDTPGQWFGTSRRVARHHRFQTPPHRPTPDNGYLLRGRHTVGGVSVGV